MQSPSRIMRQVLPACFLLVAWAVPQFAPGVDLVGYIPDYRMTNSNYVNNVLPRQIALLDEVRYFGITVNSNGSGALTTTTTHRNDISKLKQIIDALPADRRPRLDIALGGWNIEPALPQLQPIRRKGQP